MSACDKPIRVVLADDHTLVRAGIRELIERSPGVQVIAEAGNGRELLEVARFHLPDLVVVDIAMPEFNGLEATARLVKDLPSVKVIVLTMHSNEGYAVQALRAGASGFVLKQAAVAELEAAIREVMEGRTYVSSALGSRVGQAGTQDVVLSPSPLERLTPRQREILQAIAESKTTKEIAFQLNLSPKTVEFHRAELMQRLGIYDVPGLVRYAIQNGIVEAGQ